MDRKRLRRTVLGAMFCALVYAATWISVPAPAVGNVNLGDGVLLLCAWMLGGVWAVVAAALGAALADLTMGYAVYAPATFVIKALMVLAAILIVHVLVKLRVPKWLSRVLSAVGAELLMIVGYFIYEALILQYGIAAAANIPFNAIQGAVGVSVACLCDAIMSRAGITPEKDRGKMD